MVQDLVVSFGLSNPGGSYSIFVFFVIELLILFVALLLLAKIAVIIDLQITILIHLKLIEHNQIINATIVMIQDSGEPDSTFRESASVSRSGFSPRSRNLLVSLLFGNNHSSLILDN